MAFKFTEEELQAAYAGTDEKTKRSSAWFTEDDLINAYSQNAAGEKNSPAVSFEQDKKMPQRAENKNLIGAFGEGVVQGVKGFGGNIASVSDVAATILKPAGEMNKQLKGAYYDINKAPEVKNVTGNVMQQYGVGSQFNRDIQQNIIRRNQRQASAIKGVQEKYTGVPFAETAVNVGQGVGNLIPTIALNAATGGAFGFSLFGAGVFGNAMGEALSSGATQDQAMMYAAADTALEVGIEKLFGGIPFLSEGKISVKGLTEKYIKTAAGRLLVNRLADITGEGIEEVASGIIEPFLKRAFYDKDARNASLKELVSAFGNGALVSAVLGVANFGGNVQEYKAIKENIAKGKETNNTPQETESQTGETVETEDEAVKVSQGENLIPQQRKTASQAVETESNKQTPENEKQPANAGVNQQTVMPVYNADGQLEQGTLYGSFEADSEEIWLKNKENYVKDTEYLREFIGRDEDADISEINMMDDLHEVVNNSPEYESIKKEFSTEDMKLLKEADADLYEELMDVGNYTPESYDAQIDYWNKLGENFKSNEYHQYIDEAIENRKENQAIAKRAAERIEKAKSSDQMTPQQKVNVDTKAPIEESSVIDKAKVSQVVEKARNKAQKQLLRKKLIDNGKGNIVKQLEAFEKRTGIPVYFYSGELGDLVGFAKDGEMFLDINDSDILLKTSIHEAIHIFKKNNIDKFNKLQKRIFKLETDRNSEYGKVGFWTRDEYAKMGYTKEADINEEVVAKLCEECVSNPEQFLDTLGKEKTVAETIFDILREIINNIKIALTNSEKAKVDNAFIALERYLRSDVAQGDAKEAKFSKKINTDSVGNALTQQQQEYFVDSKVRDENGRLKVMYHGTPNAGFTEFRSGTYFTENPEYAEVYKNPGASSLSVKRSADNPDVYAVYLDIKKPFDTRNRKEKQIFQNEYYRQWGTGTPLMESGLPDWTDGMDLQEFIEEMEYDYDGIILDEGSAYDIKGNLKSRGLSYVVFSPEQVKNIDNKAPTSDPDIRFSKKRENHKSQQFDILQKTNPMQDDYHTGIRGTYDIHTADEVFTENEFMGTPDWNFEDAQAALKKGKVTVYSSYPISTGVFVTPSKMTAQDYAGEGKVYSEEVPLESVAWIDSDEGQYAPVNNDVRFSKRKEKMRRDVANMTWKDYTNYGWAILGRKDDGDYLLTAKDAAVFREAVRKMKPYANRNAEGNQMVIVDNKIITTNGDKNKPSYEQIIVFEGAISDTVANMERALYEAGKYLDIQTARESIRDAFPDANVTYYDKESFNTPRKFQGNIENRSGSGKAFKTVRKVQKPKSNGRINSGTLTGYISEDLDDYMSEDGLPRVTLSDDKDYIIQQGYNGGYVSFLGEKEFPTIKDIVEEMNKFIKDPDSVDSRSFIYDGENVISPSLKTKRAPVPEEYKEMSTQEITQALIKKHGAIKKGEKPARDISVPKKDMDGKNVSRGVRTIMEAAATKDDMLDAFNKAVAEGEFSYDVNRDKAAVNKAVEYIEKYGFKNTYNEWRKKVNNKQEITKDDMTQAQIMYSSAVAAGDYDTAMKLATDISIQATKAGQVVQSMRILKKTTPEGRLYYAQKTVEAIQDEVNEKYGDKSPELEVPQEMLDKLKNARTDEEIRKATADINNEIAKQLPFSWSNFIASWRYLAMLGNTRTQVRNITSNVISTMAQEYTNFVQAAIVEPVAKVATKGKIEKTSALRYTDWQMEQAEKDYTAIRDILGGQKYANDTLNSIEKLRNPFDFKGKGGKAGEFFGSVLTKWNKATNWAMDTGDKLFSAPAYKRYYARYLAANKITSEEQLTDKIRIAARSWAKKQSLESVYREENAIAKAISKLERDLANSNSKISRAGAKIVGGIMPFRSTPLNITKRAFEYTPVGIATELWANRLNNPVEVINKTAKSLSGSSLMLLGYALAKSGILTGGLGDDKEDKMKKQMGQQAYSVNVGNYSYTLDWGGAALMPLFVGAQMYDNSADDENLLNNMIDVFANASAPIMETSMMTGLMTALKTASYEDNMAESVTSFLASGLSSYLSQFVPTLLGQFARAVDDTSRSSYTNVKGVMKPLAKTAEKVQNKFPVASKANVPYMDVWGNEVKNVGGSFPGRLAYNMLSPGYIEKKSTDKVEKMLVDLYDKTGETGVLPSNYTTYKRMGDETIRFTDKQYEAYTKAYGQTSYDILEDLSSDKGFKSMEDAYKAEVIAKAYKYSTAIASNDVVDKELTARQANQQKAMEKGLSAYEVFGGLIEADGMGSEGNANGTLSKSEVMAYIESRGGLSKTEKAYLFAALGNSNWKNPYI